MTAQPDATLAELRDRLRTSAALATIWRELNQLDLTVKNTVHADEQRRADVAAQWRRWRDGLTGFKVGRFSPSVTMKRPKSGFSTSANIMSFK